MTTDASDSRAAFRASIQPETTEMVIGAADDFHDEAEAAVTATVVMASARLHRTTHGNNKCRTN